MLLDLTTWWQHLPLAQQAFCFIGLISNLLFVLYIAAQFLGGNDTDIDSDYDSSDLGILSFRGLLAFGMFMGWTGLLVLQAGFSLITAIAAGIAAGLLASWLAWRLIRLLLRLQVSGTLQLENVVGQTGTVHLLIPARQAGAGKVMVEAQGALRELEAISESDAIPTGTPILIVGQTEDGILIAQPFEAPH